MADRGEPGRRAQDKIHAARASAVEAYRPRLEAAYATTVGRQLWAALGENPGWGDDERLLWLLAPNAWLDGSSPVEVIEQQRPRVVSGPLADALKAAQL